jgi:mannose-6-phosphate isomerase-like protein (cupin superfamily)
MLVGVKRRSRIINCKEIIGNARYWINTVIPAQAGIHFNTKGTKNTKKINLLEKKMIHRYYKEGQKLDVAGLNQITVLLDRTETELTEIALNEWRAGLEGPPHAHAEKDQVFYVVSGEGKVIVGEEEFMVKPGCLIYVPTGLQHQSITTSGEPLGYILYNVFNTGDKEGHSTFADHIEKVKQIRKKQAETGESDISGAEKAIIPTKKTKFYSNVMDGKKYDFGSNSTILLLDRTETNKFEFVLVQWPADSKGAMVAHKEKEQTFFILSGEGKVTIGVETEDVKPGDLIFIPRNVPHTTETGDTSLEYLCINSIVTDTQDSSFDEMYNRIAPGRLERWKSGSNEVGE